MDKDFGYFYWPSCERVSMTRQITALEAMRRRMEIHEPTATVTDSVIFNP